MVTMGASAPQGVATTLSADGLIAVTWTGAALGILFTGIRITIRLTQMKRLLTDDYFVLLALAFLIANAVLQTLQAPHLYYMALDLTGPDIMYHGTLYTYYEFAIIGVFWSVLWAIKGSFLALFWIISDGLPHYRRAWWAITIFAIVAYIGCWLASVFTCHPASNYFKFGKCVKPIDQEGSVISICYSTAVDIITDLLIMSLPLRILWNARINSKQKVGLVIVFSLGFIIIAAAIVRAVEISGKAYSDQAALAVWSIAESSISVIVGCLPPFKTLISSKSMGSYNYGSSNFNPNSYNRNASARPTKRSHVASWSDVELPLQDRSTYQNPDIEIYEQNDVHITGGQVSGVMQPKNSQGSAEDYELKGDIKMVKEFSVVSSA
ncbi:hypothetical protein N7448_010170 [Penicillium atrosanguineum]|uniref:Rhodopsin domain-containing protein n=1 Tax=Penicillium atrosanguineum TaxID=1132637 RepID=A0A9W9GFY8_9EURO|nr:uncharacterized protein N7443_007394 [Penicillium atrosanguineum]KAJ5118463.1 hypothetical protein N7526_010100 [Penicillium atrosanguineum]KAJ5119501.1 hypothetical protein N7448_010170 [Penicillium atrosanguineum]KAJ5296501.1 hypothetical protein N7443_007394 [Penicillium atrosanguineum]KAJ5299266.1 hypothetical protein N7476_010823 [Penicillium atrosanguineum]